MNQESLRLYFITGNDPYGRFSMQEIAEIACGSGVTMLQYRHKDVDDGEFLSTALELKRIAHKHGVPFIINDRIWLFDRIRPDGIHLGVHDTPIDEARRKLGSDAIIGASSPTVEIAKRAEALGASYVAASGIFPTTTKPDAPSPRGLDAVSATAAAVSIPVVAIGGINADRAREVILAGADGIAVVSAIAHADDVAKATAMLRKIVDDALSEREYSQ